MTLQDPVARSALGQKTQSQVTASPPEEPFTLLDESWRDFVYAEIWTRDWTDVRVI